MNPSKHLLYYWKDILPDLKNGMVGWLGAKKQTSKKFAEFSDSLSQSASSWIIAFRWDEKTEKCYPLAILKAIDHPLVKVEPKKEYEGLIYYDPRQSFRLNQPTDSSDLKKYHALGAEIIGRFSDAAKKSNFVGTNGVMILTDDFATPLLAKAHAFYGQCLICFKRESISQRLGDRHWSRMMKAKARLATKMVKVKLVK